MHNFFFNFVCFCHMSLVFVINIKIDHEEYGEALVLAKLYHLDSDLVYQRQWRKSDVTLATIHDYLVIYIYSNKTICELLNS